MSTTDRILDALYPDPSVEIEGITIYQLREALIHQLYFYEDPVTKTRVYAKFFEKNVHRMSINKPILTINTTHLSKELRAELTKLKNASPQAFEEVITDSVIHLYEYCNTTRWNLIVPRRLAKWRLI